MFGFRKKNQELEELLQKVKLEAENNYKDAAQEAFGKFEKRFREMKEQGALNEKLVGVYEEAEENMKELLKGFHH